MMIGRLSSQGGLESVPKAPEKKKSKRAVRYCSASFVSQVLPEKEPVRCTLEQIGGTRPK